ncbi:MAG TPA: hypothetical protein VFZ28_02205, partial [Burkholderiaceae bacterium]|nr:hypothetical protein [Burkholderiaceae bacterium]
RANGNAATKQEPAPRRSAAVARTTVPAEPPAAPPAEPPAAPPAVSDGAPVSVATVTKNPRENCAGRHLVAMHRCLVRECEKPEYSAHRECRRVRDIELNARALRDSR